MLEWMKGEEVWLAVGWLCHRSSSVVEEAEEVWMKGGCGLVISVFGL